MKRFNRHKDLLKLSAIILTALLTCNINLQGDVNLLEVTESDSPEVESPAAKKAEKIENANIALTRNSMKKQVKKEERKIKLLKEQIAGLEKTMKTLSSREELKHNPMNRDELKKARRTIDAYNDQIKIHKNTISYLNDDLGMLF